MSQKTDLQASNADLQAILEMVNSLPDKVEAPTYETCTLKAEYLSAHAFNKITCIRIVDGTPTIMNGRLSDLGYGVVSAATIDNVLCGSIVYVSGGLAAVLPGHYCYVQETMSLGNSLCYDVYGIVLKTDTANGTTVVVTLSDDD